MRLITRCRDGKVISMRPSAVEKRLPPSGSASTFLHADALQRPGVSARGPWTSQYDGRSSLISAMMVAAISSIDLVVDESQRTDSCFIIFSAASTS